MTASGSGNAVRKILSELDAADKRRGFADPHAIVHGLLAGQGTPRRITHPESSRFALTRAAGSTW